MVMRGASTASGQVPLGTVPASGAATGAGTRKPQTDTHAHAERRDAEKATAQEPRQVTALAVRPPAQGGTAKQVPHPETEQERHARRVAWGHEWAQVMRDHSETIKAREGRA